MTVQSRLLELGIALTWETPPASSYVHATRAGNLVFLSGKGPRHTDGSLAKGVVGADVSVTQARDHARMTAIGLLSALQTEIGDLERVRRIVKVLGFVKAGPDFQDHPAVINGCSDLFVEIFGDRGKHARSAVGVASLPFGITVEIEAIVEISPRAHRRNALGPRARRVATPAA